jgi:hypothetical protein
MGHRIVFIKLGPKHASKDEIELVVFKVLGEFLLAVRDPGSCSQYLAPSSGSRYSSSFTLSAITYTQVSMQSITSTQDFPAELEER